MSPHTAKIHTLIKLGIRDRAKPLVLKDRKHRPCGFDSRWQTRPRRAASGQVRSVKPPKMQSGSGLSQSKGRLARS
jgi:hypothetical protein